ncbi:MAG: AAA family ATPase, partial [Gammaproteobacteria bacterium]|nr:AAA family ATPase [Gammaproteobacteria bacterium]
GKLPVSLLSDGVRAMVSLTADLAWRCAKLNPHLRAEAANKTEGIVLIDEVDMHLHPAWQQRVIASLQSAFPKIQFIVTTHSPQVISTVAKESIRLIKSRFNEETQKIESYIQTPTFQSLGVASSDNLAELQDVDPVPDVEPARWLTQYKRLIIQNQLESEDGKKLKEQLVNHFGPNHPQWLECERLIRLQAMKSKLPKRNDGKSPCTD